MNLTFGPMHWLGMQGMPRRTWVWYAEQGLAFWNSVVTVGAFVIAASVAVFMVNWVVSKRRGPRTPFDPWDARTLEWMIPLPPPVYNWAKIPTVHTLDEFWHRKYDEDDDGRAVRRPDHHEVLVALEYEGRNPEAEIELPSPSYFPALVGLGIMFLAYGVIYLDSGFGFALVAIGAVAILGSFVGWSVEPVEEPHAHHDDHELLESGDHV
jgi:cytochrome c oxidase subunit I